MKSSRHQRRGYTMVLLALMLFGLTGMAALVIDLGFARLTQRQLQSAADAAALQGLRAAGNTSSTYEDRQAAAEQLIDWTFDDDLNAGNGDNGIGGAGPNVEFSDGAGQPGLNASQLMTVDSVYKPTIQRRDSPVDPRTFRVALQRGGFIAGDFDLFTEGPPVPYLFGRGSLVNRAQLGNGIRVGGMGIAEARPAVKVWPATAELDGIQPVAYAMSDWGPAPSNAVAITSGIANGLTIGQSIMTAPTPPTIAKGYCAIFDPATIQVVGFGMLGQTPPEEGIVAAHNASARWSDAWDVLALLDTDDRRDILTTNRLLLYALTAPVLVVKED